MTLDMRQKLKNLAFLGMSVSVLTCTEIPIELKDPIIPESDRIVLIEELTGASCPNCPKGSAAIENILTKFPGKVVAVGIHGDFLAKPTAKSKYDFRNPKAKDLENWFKPWFGKPSASINRVPDETNTLMIDLPDLWQAAVETELQKEHKLNLLMDVKYDMASRRVDIEIAAIPLTDLPGNYAISVYLLETGIVDAQSNGSVILEDFKHKHVRIFQFFLVYPLKKKRGSLFRKPLLFANLIILELLLFVHAICEKPANNVIAKFIHLHPHWMVRWYLQKTRPLFLL
ncbi:MAG: Omp28-related outer membrane protein [Saprospiraceae bacterium]|nr:Omp28-related outer membrane protein [Saprospiraceae bacterium]